MRIQGLTSEIKAMQEKRSRVVDIFIEGVISRERDQRLVAIDSGIDIAHGRLMREVPSTSLASGALIEAFAPLAEWEFWNRDQKRTVLATLTPDIRVADYKVESLGLNPALFSNEDTRTAVALLLNSSGSQ